MIPQKISRMFRFPAHALGDGSGRYVVECPADMPDPSYICGISFLEQSAIPTVGDGIFMVKMDHDGRFCPWTGWPASEACPVSDPGCDLHLMRLAFLDFRPGATRETYRAHNPYVRWSRSRGDRMMVESSGTGGAVVAVHVCVEYLRPGTYEPPDEGALDPIWPGAPLPPPPPPPGSFTFGTWSNTSKETGGPGQPKGRSVNGTNPKFGQRLAAPQQCQPLSLKFKVETLRAAAQMRAVMSNDDGSGVVNLGTVNVNSASIFSVDLSAASVWPAGTFKRVWLEPVAGALDADIDVCADAANVTSGRGATPFAAALPDLDDWRFEVSATPA